MNDTTPTTSGKKRGRKPTPILSDAERKAVALQSAKPLVKDVSRVVAEHNQTLAPNNRNVTDHHMETVLARVASGQTIKSICEELAISAALVRQRAYDQPDLWGARLREARAMGADQSFEEMIEVARDPNIEVPRAKLIVDVLEKIAKVNNRSVYGDKVDVNHKQLVVQVTKDDLDLL